MQYYATRLSEHIAKKPNGELVCLAVPIARTGWQDYLASEIGLDIDGVVKIYRSPEEVFSPATISSFEGATFTSQHPPEFINPSNVNSYHRGHVQNVRRGEKELETGEEPLLADIVVKDIIAISQIENGVKREISCGYNCKYVPIGENEYEQKNIIGNHVSLVGDGRAGGEVRINDAKFKEAKKPMVDYKKFLTGLGLKQFAKDAEPEELEKAAKAIAKNEEGKEKEEEKKETKDEGGLEERIAKLEAAINKLIESDKGVHAEMKDCNKGGVAKDEDLIEPEGQKDGDVPINSIPGTDKAMDVLRMLKPAIARTNDARLHERFNHAVNFAKGRTSDVSASYENLLQLKKPDTVINAEATAQSKATHDSKSSAADYAASIKKYHRKDILSVANEKGGK